MCRQETTYFSRYTRSFDDAMTLLDAFAVLYTVSDSCRFRCELLRLMVKPYMHIWNRPDMESSRRMLRASYSRIVDSHGDHMSQDCEDLVREMINIL